MSFCLCAPRRGAVASWLVQIKWLAAAPHRFVRVLFGRFPFGRRVFAVFLSCSPTPFCVEKEKKKEWPRRQRPTTAKKKVVPPPLFVFTWPVCADAPFLPIVLREEKGEVSMSPPFFVFLDTRPPRTTEGKKKKRGVAIVPTCFGAIGKKGAWFKRSRAFLFG